MPGYEVKNLVIFLTLVFSMAPVFILIYIAVYNKRKKRDLEEKAQMKLSFEAEMAKAQLEIQEQTMQTIGADLHDNIGQLLGLTSLTLGSIEAADLAQSQHKIDAALDLTRKSIKEMRLLGKLLQGDQILNHGLSEAIKHVINWIEKSGNYQVCYKVTGQQPDISDKNKDLIIFRILQETLNNIIKHAQATHIDIILIYQAYGIQLQITDNGKGFYTDSTSVTQNGMGLLNIHKRADIIGGKAVISSNPGDGTSTSIFIPYI